MQDRFQCGEPLAGFYQWLDTFLTQGSDTCLSKVTSKGTIWVPLVREARSWWVFAKTLAAAKAKAKAKSGAKVRFDPDAMDVDKLKTQGQEPCEEATGRESAMVSRHTTYRKVHEPPTGASRALEVTPFKFLLKRMVNHDDFEGQKPVCESVKACGLCACGSSSVFQRETGGEGSSNGCVGMSACIGSNSLVGMSACIGSDSLVGMSACVGSDRLVGMSACVERPQGSVDLCEGLRDQSFCVFGAGKSIEPSSQRCVHARVTCCIARAFGTMMRMLLIWLLVFSTFVGVGCDSVGAPPKWLSQADFATSHFGLSQADFATSHSWLSQADFATSHSGLSQADFAIAYSGLTDYTTSFLAYHGREQFIRRRVATGLSFGCQCHEVVFGLEGGRIGQRGRPNPDPLQTDTIRDVVSLVDCYTQKGWLETQLNLPNVEGLEPPEEEYIPGPPTSITQYAVPITATDPCNRVYIQDQSMQTSDLELAHAQRYQRASEGEAWAHYGWDAERVKNLLQDRNFGINRRGEFGPPSAVQFGRLRGIKEWRSRAISRSSFKYVGMGLFLLCFPDRYGPLQESVGPNEGLVAEAISGGISECGWVILDSGHGYAAAWDFAFNGEGFRHCWWAFDYDGYSGWALDDDHGSYAATSGSYKGRGCDRAQSRA